MRYPFNYDDIKIEGAFDSENLKCPNCGSKVKIRKDFDPEWYKHVKYPFRASVWFRCGTHINVHKEDDSLWYTPFGPDAHCEHLARKERERLAIINGEANDNSEVGRSLTDTNQILP